MNPLVVTLAIEDTVQQRFERERANYFPAGRTKVGAHITLFHAVPGELRDDVERDLDEEAGPPFGVTVAEVRSLGRGVAYFLESAELSRRHRALQESWWPYLTKQDQQGFRPHVTVQNKAEPAAVRRALVDLRAGFAPFEVEALGFVLWRYDGGPWTQLRSILFTA